MTDFNEDKQNSRLDEIRKKEEEDVAQILAHRHNLTYINLYPVPINTDALRLIEEADARAGKMAVFNLVGKKIDVALVSIENPLTKQVLDQLERKGYEPRIFMVSPLGLEKAWSRYTDLSHAEVSRTGSLEISSEQIAALVAKTKNIDDIKKQVDEVMQTKKAYRVSMIIETILAGALATKSSDIHIEPEENYANLRYRIDGVLIQILQFDRATMDQITSRIKLLSGLKLNVKNEAQDGRFSIKITEGDIEIRTSVLPGSYAESIVLRLLNPKSIAVPLEEMGMSENLLKILLAEIAKPNGMLLTTGPTGSGKTTTLYAFLRKVYDPGIKILTIEDPVEYHLPGITQTQVDDEKGYTFLNGLRAALRQDPDVIMVGEIRDEETAKIAINAALTGHLVFSTLHTNNAAGAFPRLIDLGVNPKVISSAINATIAQRLLRKLCTECKKEIEPSTETKQFLEKVLASIRLPEPKAGLTTTKVFTAVGCDKCNKTGYKGRVGIYEVILKSPELDLLINNNPSEREIKKVAADKGFLDMRQDGVIKILKGITDLDELGRVIDLNEEFV